MDVSSSIFVNLDLFIKLLRFVLLSMEQESKNPDRLAGTVRAVHKPFTNLDL